MRTDIKSRTFFKLLAANFAQISVCFSCLIWIAYDWPPILTNISLSKGPTILITIISITSVVGLILITIILSRAAFRFVFNLEVSKEVER